MQPALLGTVLPERKGSSHPTTPDPVIQAAVHTDVGDKKDEDDNKRRGVWESKRASLYPAKEQRKRIRQIVSKLITIFLIKWKQMPKQSYFCISFPARAPRGSLRPGSRFLQYLLDQ